MELRNYSLGDEHQIIALFEMVFKQKMSIEQWYWRFRDNPAGKYLIKLMWDDGILIGHYAVSPIIMNINGEEVLTAHSLPTMTHPEYGGRGIFKTLSLELYKELEETKECKAIWGFPNNNSHSGFIKSLGWSNLAVIDSVSSDSLLTVLSVDSTKLTEIFSNFCSFEFCKSLNCQSNLLLIFSVSAEKSLLTERKLLESSCLFCASCWLISERISDKF